MNRKEKKGAESLLFFVWSPGQQVGVAKSFKVYPGDKVKIQAAGETGMARSAANSWGEIVAGGGGNGSSSYPKYPKAFVNLLVVDKNYNFIVAAWDQINGGEQVGASPKALHDYMMQEYVAREEGYIYVYVSNENATLVEVCFDDVVITHAPGSVIQANEYYPFGVQAATSWLA